MCFTVCDDGSVEELFEGLACGEVEVLGNFQLSSDDPRNYTDKISVLTQTRYFPEEQYPSGSDPDHQVATATSFPLLQPLILHRQVLLQGLPHLRQVHLQLLYQTLIQQLKR